MSKILNDVGLAGGEADTQFLGGGPALLRKGAPALVQRSPWGRNMGKEK